MPTAINPSRKKKLKKKFEKTIEKKKRWDGVLNALKGKMYMWNNRYITL